MMKEFCIEIEVGEANPLSFLSLDSPTAPSPAFFGDFPALLALAVNFEGEFEVYFLEGDAKFAPPILVGELPPAIVACFLILRPGESYS